MSLWCIARKILVNFLKKYCMGDSTHGDEIALLQLRTRQYSYGVMENFKQKFITVIWKQNKFRN